MSLRNKILIAFALIVVMGGLTFVMQTDTIQLSVETDLDVFLRFSWPVMAFLLGLIDGFNPCAMWTLMVLLGFLLNMEKKQYRWLIGGVFLSSSGLLYGGALLAYLLGFEALRVWIFDLNMPFIGRGMALLIFIASGFSFYAFWKNKVECNIRDLGERQRFHTKLSAILKKENLFLILPGVVFLAFSVNVIELLCSIAIPVAFTGQIVALNLSFPAQLTAIAIYDFAYMLDDLIVFLIAMFTFSLTTFSPRFVRFSHLAAGILLFVMAIFSLLKYG